MQTAELHVPRVSWARDATTRRHSTLISALLLTRIRSPVAQSRNETLRWVLVFNLGLVGAIFSIIKFVH